MMYSMIDAQGYVVRSQYTDNPDAAVLDGHRLLPDVVPEFDPLTQEVRRVEPITPSAAEVLYEITAIPEDRLMHENAPDLLSQESE